MLYSYMLPAQPVNGCYRSVYTSSAGTYTYMGVKLASWQPMTIVTNPTALSVKAGAQASFSVGETTGNWSTTQWQKSTDNGATWTTVYGPVSSYTYSDGVYYSTYTFIAALSDNGTLYRGQLMDANHNQTATSTTAKLTLTS